MPVNPRPGADPIRVVLREPTAKQLDFLVSGAKRKVIRAGRRGGKTTGVAMKAIQAYGEQKRVLYGVPTDEQLEVFWTEVKVALADPIERGIYVTNETKHILEPNPKLVGEGVPMRIRAKTCWNADTLRGDFADLLILDEFQMMGEDAWEVVGMPMLMDNDGDAIFIYTPPSLKTRGLCRARDPRYASKMFQAAFQAQQNGSTEWAAFHFTSRDNPYLSPAGLDAIARGMTRDSFLREILAEDEEEGETPLVYGAFREDTQLIEDFLLPIRWPRLTGHDFGQANPAALFIAQNPGPAPEHGIMPGDFVVYDEYLPGAGFSARQHAEAFLSRTKGLTVERRVGGNQTTEEEVRQAYASHGWTIMCPRVKTPAEQISRTVALMERDRVFVFKSLLRLREELMTCQWERDQEGYRLDKIRHESRFHLLAALRYIMSEFTPEPALGNKPKTTVQYFPQERNSGRLALHLDKVAR